MINTRPYCYVKNGKIIEGPTVLPVNWENAMNVCYCHDNAFLKDLGWLPVVQIEPNSPENKPILEKKEYFITEDNVQEIFTWRERTLEEQTSFEANISSVLWMQVRKDRDQFLKETDNYVTIDRWEDYTPEIKQAWKAYRQALRDIPQNFQDPNGVVWPVKPVY
jgi:hypothetical protein